LNGGVFIISIQDSLGFKLAKALQNIDESFAKELTDTGITSKHYGTMLIVKENPGITQIEAAKIQRIDRTSIGQLIDLLEEKQLLMRSKHPSDRRAYCLQLTKQGDEVIYSLWNSMKKCEDEMLSVLDSKEKNLFIDLINKLSKEKKL
jgi:DNA-binding MarR family transcriptional regulator